MDSAQPATTTIPHVNVRLSVAVCLSVCLSVSVCVCLLWDAEDRRSIDVMKVPVATVLLMRTQKSCFS